MRPIGTSGSLATRIGEAQESNRELLEVPFLQGGVRLSQVALAAGTPSRVYHRLGRRIDGVLVLRLESAVANAAYPKVVTNTAEYVELLTNAAATAELWVF